MFYDVDQIGQVAAGTLTYHAIQPYTFLSLPEPFPVRQDPVYGSYGHMAYDSTAQRLYLIQRYVGPNAEPIAHVLQLSGIRRWGCPRTHRSDQCARDDPMTHLATGVEAIACLSVRVLKFGGATTPQGSSFPGACGR